jgi:phenylpropionate dioxygenase-like ring-hydroxylating dioxygenase large terminal subunit
MFDGFANLWTPVILARRLGRKPLKVVVAGEPVVFFRDVAGGIGALIDRCPHRGASLSLGRIGADGCLECPFHGWRFDRSGANRYTPLNPDAKRELLGATALPVRQVGDLIWIRTGRDAPDEPVAPDGLKMPGVARIYLERLWECHWTRAMENMLDSPHLPFVHRRTIGRSMRRRLRPDSRMDVRWQETSYGGRAWSGLDGEESAAYLDYFRPNIMVLNIPIPGRHFRIHALIIPEASGRTRLILAGSRDFAKWRLLNPFFSWQNGFIAGEDKAVVESTGPTEVPPPGTELSVATDAATLQFRRYYYSALRGSTA